MKLQQKAQQEQPVAQRKNYHFWTSRVNLCRLFEGDFPDTIEIIRCWACSLLGDRFLWYEFCCLTFFHIFPSIRNVGNRESSGCGQNKCLRKPPLICHLPTWCSTTFLEIIKRQNFRNVPMLHIVQISERETTVVFPKEFEVAEDVGSGRQYI